MKVVVDASVALKWFFAEHDESDVPLALNLLDAVSKGQLDLVQPPHFIAEVAAVLAREAASSASVSLRRLLSVEMEIATEPPVYAKAVDLSVRLDHHLFDTLYHAVAFDATARLLVTADDRYFRKAEKEGRIVRLTEFTIG